MTCQHQQRVTAALKIARFTERPGGLRGGGLEKDETFYSWREIALWDYRTGADVVAFIEGVSAPREAPAA